MTPAVLAVLSVASYVLAYAGVMAGAEAGHLARVLASVPRDPSPSQAQVVAGVIRPRTEQRPRRPCPGATGGVAALPPTDTPSADEPRIPDPGIHNSE